jgi:succinyl-CoA synthetase alpha subunit
MLAGFDLLAADPETKVIVLMSKPPAPEVATAILARAATTKKPVVVNFLGSDPLGGAKRGNLLRAATLEEAATVAVGALRRRKTPRLKALASADGVAAARRRFAKEQAGLLALFSGGTFCAEALMLWASAGLAVHSNVPLDKRLVWQAGAKGQTHVALDLGADEFTLGKPHPMIDPSGRIEAVAQAGRDPRVGVLLLDVVLGHGAHADPAGALVPAIRRAVAEAKRRGRRLAVVAFVCGTERDPQALSTQEATLRAAGAMVEGSSTRAARLAAALIGARQ